MLNKNNAVMLVGRQAKMLQDAFSCIGLNGAKHNAGGFISLEDELHIAGTQMADTIEQDDISISLYKRSSVHCFS